MNFSINKLLVGISIGALAIFLSFWLKDSYDDAKSVLRKELDLTLSEVNEGINKVFIEKVSALVDSEAPKEKMVTSYSKSFISTKTSFDSTHHFDKGQIEGSFMVQDSARNNPFKIMFTNDDEDSSPSSAVKILVNSQYQQDTLDLFTFLSNDEEEITNIEKKYRALLLKKALPAVFTMREIQKSVKTDSLQVILKSRGYLRPTAYAATFREYKPYLFTKIIPHLSIGFLLMGIVATAFFYAIKSLKEQERMGKLKNDFVSNMTHELKTPISTVSVAIEALQRFDALEDRKKTEEYLSISKNELSRLAILVDKVLKMSQFDGKGAPLGKMSVTDLKEIIQNVSSSMRLHLENYRATLDVSVEEGDYQLLGDKVHLANIIYNLMDNALKYGGDKPMVKVSLIHKADKILLSVKDKGIGIAKEYQEKVFEQFFRVPKGNIHDVKGYGLGLSYVASVVKAHGGVINIISEENNGTEFKIEFPKHA